MRILVRAAAAADVDGIARVHVAAWRAAYRGLVPNEQIEARTIQLRQQQWTKTLQESDHITLVACDAIGPVCGFASASRLDNGRFQSYLETLYVAPEVWRHGVGRTLIAALSAHFVAMGIESLALRTLRLGAARAFYERLGARVVPEGLVHDHEFFDDVVYAFDDLNALAAEYRSASQTLAE